MLISRMSSTEVNPPREVVIFGKEALSDVTLVVGNKEFKVHKVTLALMSNYFEALFFGNFKEKYQDRIELEADPIAFQRMLTFIYDRDFGDETFLKCPSKLNDPSKGFGIDSYALYEVLDRIDVKGSQDDLWNTVDKFKCPTEIINGVCVRDCEHTVCIVLSSAPSTMEDQGFTSRAVQAWMQKFSSLVPQAVLTNEDALPKIIKEMTEGNPPPKVVHFGKKSLSDVTLVVGNKEFKVHKMSLALSSDYFQALFFGNFKEKGQDRIELEADPVAFQRMLIFIYNGNFGDETFLKCPSKLGNPSKVFGIDRYSLYEILDRFDVKNSIDQNV